MALLSAVFSHNAVCGNTTHGSNGAERTACSCMYSSNDFRQQLITINIEATLGRSIGSSSGRLALFSIKTEWAGNWRSRRRRSMGGGGLGLKVNNIGRALAMSNKTATEHDV